MPIQLTKEEKFKQILALCATHTVLQNESDKHWCSEEGIDLGNAIYSLTCELVGFDTNEDDEWGQYTIKATQQEITQYTIDQLIKRFPEFVPEHKKLFIAVIESFYQLEHWKQLLERKDEDSEDREYECTLWWENIITTDCGWDAEEQEELEALEVSECALSYGHYGHSIFRLI